MNKFDIKGLVNSIIKGEIPGARKTLILIFSALFIWITGIYLSSNATSMEQAYEYQNGRFVILGELAEQYKQLVADHSGSIKTNAGDLIPVFSQIVEEAGMRDRLIQISALSRGISVNMERLYAEDLVTILNELEKFGIRVYLTDLRALPYQDKRLFSFTASLEVKS